LRKGGHRSGLLGDLGELGINGCEFKKRGSLRGKPITGKNFWGGLGRIGRDRGGNKKTDAHENSGEHVEDRISSQKARLKMRWSPKKGSWP